MLALLLLLLLLLLLELWLNLHLHSWLTRHLHSWLLLGEGGEGVVLVSHGCWVRHEGVLARHLPKRVSTLHARSACKELLLLGMLRCHHLHHLLLLSHLSHHEVRLFLLVTHWVGDEPENIEAILDQV